MEKIWLKSYPPGVPADIDPDQYRSLVHLLEEAFQKYADRNAYVCMDKFLTYAELDTYSRQLGAWLQSRGLKKGARVGQRFIWRAGTDAHLRNRPVRHEPSPQGVVPSATGGDAS